MPYLMYILIQIVAVCCFIASFVNITVFSFVSNIFIGLSIGEPLYFFGTTLLVLVSFENVEEEKNIVKIKAMPSNIKIDIENKTFEYKNSKISLDEIVAYEVINNDEVVIKSGLTEAIIGGLLFGNAGGYCRCLCWKKASC